MPIEILEILPGLDYDRRRGYSQWLFIRFPVCNPHRLTARKLQQMMDATRMAFVERHGYMPYSIQNIDRSAWWRAGPVEVESAESNQ